MGIKIKLLFTIVILEFLIIVFGYFYVVNKSPGVFQHKPSILVIDVHGSLIDTVLGGVYDRGGTLGELTTSADEVVRVLQTFERDDNFKGFILDIDSNGGEGSAAEDIARQVRRMDKPVVAVVRDQALSSGYYVAASTNRIYANAFSNIGNIGVISSFVNRTRNGTEQECFVSSTKIKGMFLSDCAGFDPEEVQTMQHYVKVSHDYFIYDIALLRNLSIPYIAKLADGSIYHGGEALKLQLIDAIGDAQSAKRDLEKQTGSKLELIYLRDLKAAYDNDKKSNAS